MIRNGFILACFVLVISAGSVMAAEDTAEQAAVSAAESWLSLVDDGKYGESWTEASEVFRNAITQEQWEQALLKVRKPLGKLISRKMKSAV